MKLNALMLASFVLTVQLLSAGSSPAALVITDDGATAPTTDILISNAASGSFTRVSDPSATLRTRGNTFIVGSEAIDVGAVTLRMRTNNAGNSVPATGDQGFTLTFAEWGADTDMHQPGTEIFSETGFFPANMDAGDYFTINLAAPLQLDANSNYGFFVEWDTNVGNDIFLAQNGGFSDGSLWVENESTMNTDQDITFYLLQGSAAAIPEPASLTVWALFGLAMLRLTRRRRRRERG